MLANENDGANSLVTNGEDHEVVGGYLLDI